jgi:acetolactate synthase-1/2/3 large subunit
MTNPDFVKIVDGYGIPSKRVDKRDELQDALQEMYDHEGPYFLEVTVEMEENVFPMVPSGDSVSNIRLE